LGLHLRPVDLDLLNKFSNSTENTSQASQMLVIKNRRNLLDNDNFDLKFFFFKKLLHEGNVEKSFEMISLYFLRGVENSNEIKLVYDEYLKANQIDSSINILILGTKLFPKEENFYFLLYELFLKKEDYLSSFKAYIHYLYFSRNISVNQILICGELMEKSNYFWHSFLFYYQYLIQFPKDEKILAKMKEIVKEKISGNFDVTKFSETLSEEF
jgi:hypothetical protein